MAFNAANLSVLNYANGFTLWHYTTPDASTTVDTSGYFNAVSDIIKVGDLILGNTNTGATSAFGAFVVASNSNGVVDVANMLQFNSANSD